MRWAGRKPVGAAALLAMLFAATPGRAQNISDEAVKSFMNYAWAQVPGQYTTEQGETILIDKTKQNEVVIPVNAARDVIIAAWRSYRAQICNMPEEQAANYRSLVARENAKKVWSRQQGVFIMTLHLTVVQLMAGKVKIVETKDGKVLEETELPGKSVKPCGPEEKVRLKEMITAYVKSGPVSTAGPPAAASADASSQSAAGTPVNK